MSEQDKIEEERDIPAAVGENPEGDSADGDGGTIIRDTDIVFDCPHCGHNLAIDYRGAGLPIACVNCGESVLVPIPDGMKIDDLDIEPGEILKQLFAARRNLQRAEAQIEALELDLANAAARRDSLLNLVKSLAAGLKDVKGLSHTAVKMHEREMELLDRLAENVAAAIGETAQDDISAAEEEKEGVGIAPADE